MIKKLSLFAAVSMIAYTAFAQKVDYSSGIIKVDGKDVAKVIRIKDKGSFGLTSSYELDNMAGTKLIIATMATDFVPSRNDAEGFYYRFTFLTSGQVAIFGLSKLGPEKSFAKLMGESGIVVNDQLDAAKVNELIALRSKNPKVQIEYNLVHRSPLVNVTVKDHNIFQDVQIGTFKDITRPGGDFDAYEFALPSGLIVARVTFKAGTKYVENCVISTNKDAATYNVDLRAGGSYGQAIAASEGVDRHEETIKKIARWLVQHNYM